MPDVGEKVPDRQGTSSSFVLSSLSVPDYPAPEPACATCPAAVWYLTTKGPQCRCEAHGFVSWVSNVNPVLACDTRERLLNEAESPDARYTGSWVLGLLSQEDYPDPRPACASCPAAVWYLTVKGLRCLCDQHHFISWVSNREPVLACDTRERLSYENAVPDDDAPIDYGD